MSTLAGDRRALTFSMSGLSKIAGLPQMKLGWIVASGPGDRSPSSNGRAGADRRHVSLGRDAGAGRPAPFARAFQRHPFSQHHGADSPTNCLEPGPIARVRPRHRGDAAAHRRRLVRRAAGASHPHGRGMDAQTARRVQCPGATRILLRLRIRGVSGLEPPARARHVRGRRVPATAASYNRR